MSLHLGGGRARLWYSYRFYEDYRGLDSTIARKTSNTLDLVRQQGVYHASLHTRKVAGNPDGRVRLMNVDDQYRMVVALEGDDVLFLHVGNHDETLDRAARMTLREAEERLKIDPDTFARPRGGKPALRVNEPTLFAESPPSVQQLVADHEKTADIITGDLFGALDGYRDGVIEDWMIFLSPLQSRAVQRWTSGPSRVTGGPGTGKTVVALHRTATLARNAPSGTRILMTSFVRNIPETLDGLFERLAPDAHDRVAFRHIHDLALDLLRNRDVRVNPDWNAARARFDRCYASDAARRERLRVTGFDPGYIWQELTRVIEGRGVRSFDDYLRLARHGRRRAMQEPVRRLVWSLYEDYREACRNTNPPLASPEAVIALALDAVRREPTGKPYHAVIVDEAQDLTEVGIRFLCALLEDGDRGRLLLVGDQSQRVYAGGFRLSDAGVSVRGRSTQLRVCYRSTDEIMRVVAALGRELSTEDFGEDGLQSLAASTVRQGVPPTLHVFKLIDEEVAWVVEELRADDDPASVAILVPTNTGVDDWVGRVKVAGLPYRRLTDYAGKPLPGVKIGTYARSKGLEFKRVILPGLSDGRFPWGDPSDTDGMLLQGSMLYVAMSRARDRLDISYTCEPSYFLRAMIPMLEPTNLSAAHV